MNGIPKALAGLTLVAVAAAGCGDDNGDGPTASDPTASGPASSSGSVTESPSVTVSSPSGGMTDNGDPVPSPIMNKALKAAVQADFPALVPAGVPAGRKVTKATYSPKRGGQWRPYPTHPSRLDVTLAQSTKPVGGIVDQSLPGAKAAGEVDLSDYGTGTWSAYSGSDAAGLAKALSGTAAVVVGHDQDTVVALA